MNLKKVEYIFHHHIFLTFFLFNTIKAQVLYNLHCFPPFLILCCGYLFRSLLYWFSELRWSFNM